MLGCLNHLQTPADPLVMSRPALLSLLGLTLKGGSCASPSPTFKGIIFFFPSEVFNQI